MLTLTLTLMNTVFSDRQIDNWFFTPCQPRRLYRDDLSLFLNVLVMLMIPIIGRVDSYILNHVFCVFCCLKWGSWALGRVCHCLSVSDENQLLSERHGPHTQQQAVFLQVWCHRLLPHVCRGHAHWNHWCGTQVSPVHVFSMIFFNE